MNFILACTICEQAFKKDKMQEHYEAHTKEELIKEMMDVSLCLATYGEYA